MILLKLLDRHWRLFNLRAKLKTKQNRKFMETAIEEINDKAHMNTLVSCLNNLQKDGYSTQFKATAEGLLSLATQKTFHPGQVKIAKFYRFEGESDPSDSSILYAIEAWDGEKGTLVDGYGRESDPQVSLFLQQVEEIHK